METRHRSLWKGSIEMTAHLQYVSLVCISLKDLWKNIWDKLILQTEQSINITWATSEQYNWPLGEDTWVNGVN